MSFRPQPEPTPYAKSVTHFLSPKASLNWEPSPGQHYYFSYARSFTPAGQNISFQGTVSPGQPNLEPDKNHTLELGGKWSLIGDQLGATAAVFRTVKNRGSYSDPVTGASVASGERDRVQGIELGLTGKITRAWEVQASYSYYDGKILAAAPLSVFVPVDTTGNEVAYVSKNNVALWTTYNVATLIPYMPGKPIFYGTSNFIFQSAIMPLPKGHYPGQKADENSGFRGPFKEFADAYAKGGPIVGEHEFQSFWQLKPNLESFVAYTNFEGGKLKEVLIYPVDLGLTPRPGSQVGIPRKPSPEVAKKILDEIVEYSRPFGTVIEIENGVGIIHVK